MHILVIHILVRRPDSDRCLSQYLPPLFQNDVFRHCEVSKGLALLREVVGLVPGHLGARLLMARASYSTGQADLAHQTLQVM